jgi:hypothetical protein
LESSAKKGSRLSNQNDSGKALLALVDRTETLSKQILALINLNAILLREMCLAQQEPLEHFAKIEAEIGGLGEAIAMGIRAYTDVPVSSQAITEVFEQVLRQGRSLIEHAAGDPLAPK